MSDGPQIPRHLAPPVVSPDEYDEDYYLSTCGGHAEWVESGGLTPASLYAGCLTLAGLGPGETIVDVGAGRGDLAAVAVASGAARVIGIEYSRAAAAIAHRTFEVNQISDRAVVLLADARAMPLPAGTADLVTMLDVVEHLAAEELDSALREVHRVLRPGGRVFIHTMPNRWIYTVTYRWQRALVPSRRRRWPADPRNEYEHRMHVNEQTIVSIRRVLRRAGFAGVRAWVGDWIYTDHVPAGAGHRTYHRLAAHRLTAPLGAGNIFAEARRPT